MHYRKSAGAEGVATKSLYFLFFFLKNNCFISVLMHYRKLAGAEGAATNPQTTRAYRASQWRRSQVCTYFF